MWVTRGPRANIGILSDLRLTIHTGVPIDIALRLSIAEDDALFRAGARGRNRNEGPAGK